MSIDPGLVEAVRDRDAILFVGAGVSQNLGLPGFSKLIELMAEDLGFDSDVFKQFGDFMTLAEFYEHERGDLGRLRSQLDQAWHRPDIDLSASEIHRHIVELGFPIIYTTNWDQWLERSYARARVPYRRIASVDDLRRLSSDETQIVKFHGDFEAASTDALVLTEASYLSRLEFRAPLDLKLRADSLGRPILFIGYSLEDINVRYLLYRLDQLWREAERFATRPKSFVALHRPNAIQQAVLERRGVTTLAMTGESPGAALQAFLAELLGEAQNRVLTGLW